MKQIIITLFFVINLFSITNSNEKKILGEWRYQKTQLTEKIGENLYRQKNSGVVGELKINFKNDYTGTSKNSQSEIIDQFTWKVSRDKLTIKYLGDDLILKSFSNEFKIKILTKHKMVIYNQAENKSIFFER
ncbi:hypothetical protein [Flavobacterium cyclinae]|uniref:hypothetical protein n=1 Tax=Flavobacterium cyclinae TaxID=2895947 RepID=UPI001E581198|nr:hypothetical protein [Flavobacterium cyclinae]UGS22066.1 hypothetical protein LOS86_05445 [Flavobacterium cyclinae]